MAGKIVFDESIMKFIAMLESMSGAAVKDCVIEDSMVLFVIKEGDIGKAIGKKGFNVKRMEHALKKKVKMVEFHPELTTFIGNLVAPAKVKEMSTEEGIVTIIPGDLVSRGQIIGRDAKHLRFYESMVKRFFDIIEIKVK